MNHFISFIWSSFDSVEGWNSLSIHFCAAASSAHADPVAANSAMAAAYTKRCLFIERLLRCVSRQIAVGVLPKPSPLPLGIRMLKRNKVNVKRKNLTF
jgi:hypothetical protein